MNLQETKMLLAVINSMYPSWNPPNKDMTAKVWHMALENYDYHEIEESLKIHFQNDTKGFPPMPGNLIAPIVEKRMSAVAPNESEAWSKVLEALGDSIYHSTARFRELPPLVQQAVGSAYVLTTWAQMESEDLEVVHSNFNRAYRSLAEQASRENATTGAIPSPVPEIEQRFDTSHLIEEKRPEKTEEEKAELYRWLEMQRGNVNGV